MQRAIAQSGKWTGIKPNDLRGAHNRKKDRCPYADALTTENTPSDEWLTGARRKLIPSSAARANPRGPAAEVADTAVGKAVSRRQT